MAYADAEKGRKNRREYQARRRAEDPVYRERCNATVRRNNKRPEVMERRRQYQRNQRSTPGGWAAQTLVAVRKDCKRKGIPFDLTVDDLLPSTHCPVTGMPFVFGGAGRTDASPSVDRVQPKLGYVKGNVHVISWLANRVKTDCTDPAVFRAVAIYVETHT